MTNSDFFSKKKLVVSITIIIGFIMLSVYIFYPRDLISIIGKEPVIDSNIHLTVTNRNSILEDGSTAESYNENHSKEILEYLKSYKYRRTNTSYRKLDNVEYFIIKIENNGEEVFRTAVRGDKYLSVIDKNGAWSLYKVSGNKFDTKILKNFYESLRST
ncbi:hypothetical protein, partial [Anaerosolibacter sp.]|uniref:hypothetical protein n=1 Tax=Anaerosolibacter sp. TaxID=1872527 RepID=UPI0039EEA8AC